MSPSNPDSPKVLFAILDWGLGHATRSTPLIQAAISLGCEVHVASRGSALVFLRKQLIEGGVIFHEKPGRNVSYAKRGIQLKIAIQLPGFFKSIVEEREWTDKIHHELGITHILSDNCYGAHHREAKCILMSHQLHLPVHRPLRFIARWFVRHHARPFDEVWIPDCETEPRLSGWLGNPTTVHRARFIGALSRLNPQATPGPWKRVGMVSGPEPHRSLMENALRQWMRKNGSGGLIISGQPNGTAYESNGITTWPNPTAEALSEALLGAESIVCRSGYSTLLDLFALGQRAILIPTPGQPEQVYLAQWWHAQFGFSTCTQEALEKGQIPTISGAVPPRPIKQSVDELMRDWMTSSVRS